jgi:hypothetical protein
MSELMKTGQPKISKIELSQKLADEDDYLRENKNWGWTLERKEGRGLLDSYPATLKRTQERTQNVVPLMRLMHLMQAVSP